MYTEHTHTHTHTHALTHTHTHSHTHTHTHTRTHTHTHTRTHTHTHTHTNLHTHKLAHTNISIQHTSLFGLRDLSIVNSILPSFLLIFSRAFHLIFFSSIQRTPVRLDKVIWRQGMTICNPQCGASPDLLLEGNVKNVKV